MVHQHHASDGLIVVAKAVELRYEVARFSKGATFGVDCPRKKKIAKLRARIEYELAMQWSAVVNLNVLDISGSSGLTGSLPAGLQQRYDDNLLTVYWAGSGISPPSGIAPA
jgi:hypothetical protein